MSTKVIFVLLDGLRFDVAQSSMGYLGHLVETAQASFYKVQSELPSVSRPLYEVLMTGTPSSLNRITSNSIVRLSNQTHLFHLATQNGLTTAAVGFYFFSELYNRSPFNRFTDREQHDPNLPIQHGKFYWDDAYPDSHVFADAEVLRQNWHPDFMVVHPSGIDDIGHKFGGESKEYRNKTIAMDDLLCQVLPVWMDAGYHILVTADHGMNADANHGGTSPDVREVPLFCIGNAFTPGTHLEGLSQLAITPMLCQLLSLPPGPNMQSIPVPGFREQSESLTVKEAHSLVS
ncbi:MAG: alkaline phosphatase family protein [Elainellaceae cyanobacterium]